MAPLAKSAVSDHNRPVSNPDKSTKSEKLKHTLTELECALSRWNDTELGPGDRDGNEAADGSDSPVVRSPLAKRIPDDMRRKTRELLDRLKAQIDEL